MELQTKTNEKITFTAEINVSLANALRRSLNEVPVLAVTECDVYKNDSALYDEIIAHRLGLVPLKHQKLKGDQTVELKFKAKVKGDAEYVLSSELGSDSVYQDIPIVLLANNQEIEIVARAGMGKGVDHSKFSPGLMYYNHLPNIKIGKEAQSNTELAQLYPEVFEFKNKLAVKDASKCTLDQDDFKDFPGITVTEDNNLVISIESWGQMSAKDILIESAKVLKTNLNELKKAIK
ncbi:MAG: DNA-directed RNA polymerase subunit D [Patescibacteria group bacterium]|jgi:DNA-directed RNA polymerase subunit D